MCHRVEHLHIETGFFFTWEYPICTCEVGQPVNEHGHRANLGEALAKQKNNDVGCYPLVNIQKTMERSTIFNG